VSVSLGILIIKAAGNNFLKTTFIGTHALHGNTGGLILGETIHACTDRREGNAFDIVRECQLKALCITALQQFCLMLMAAMPDRADGVYDPPGRKLIRSGYACFARWTTAQRATLFQQCRPGSTMNRAIHATTAQQAAIGSVDDGIDI
jgi:hypothetical protein